VCNFVRHYTAQLLIISSPEESSCYEKLAVARIGGVNFIVARDGDLHLLTPAAMIHCVEEGNHDLSQPIRFPWIDPVV
jgi:hypothetical protein